MTEIDDLWDRFSAAVYRHALALVARVPDAEDVVQIVFTKLIGRLADGLRADDPEAYLHRAARNEALRIAMRRPHTGEPPELVVAGGERTADEAERVNRALGLLPAEQRQVVVLHILEGLTCARVAELLEVPEDTIASRWRYARAKLRELLDES